MMVKNYGADFMYIVCSRCSSSFINATRMCVCVECQRQWDAALWFVAHTNEETREEKSTFVIENLFFLIYFLSAEKNIEI